MFLEVQKKAQALIETVVGSDRLPTMEDAVRMQYIRGCVKESVRWVQINILGVPQSVIKDDEYMDYKVPAGSTVANNVW